MRRLLLLFTICISSQLTYSQGFLKKLGENKVVSDVLEGKPAISTSFKDVDLKNTMPPDFGANETYTSLSSLTKNEEGKYELASGFYETTNLSYFLKAGTNVPAKGDSYGNAPIKGKMDDIVEAILIKSQELWRSNDAGNS